MKKLYTGQTANDSSKANAFTTNGAGVLTIHAFGTWAGATVSVYMSLNGTSNGKLLTDLTFTVDDIKTLTVADEVTIWAQIAGVGGGTSVNCWISGMGND